MPVYKRGNVWWYKFQLKGVTVHESAGKGATYEQAKALEAKARQDIIKGRLGLTVYTLEDAAAQWLEGEATRLKSYQSLINIVRIIRPYIENTPIDKAQEAAQRIIKAFPTLQPETVNRRLAVVRRLCNLAHEWKWIKHPVKISLLSGEKQRHVYLTIPELIQFAKAARRSKWHVILAAFTGMRESEILGMDPKDARTFIKSEMIYLTNTKNGKPRLIPLNKPAKCALERLDWGVTYPILRRDIEIARGDRDIRFHDLRHTAASLMVKGNASMVAIRDILGHSNLGVTSRYSHLATAELRKAVDRMGRKSKPKKAA
jgi:integrase